MFEQHAHVMHIMLAVSAAHRRTLSGNPGQSPEELAHLTHAISIFRRTLERDWDQEADAVLTTSMFLCILHFLDGPIPVDRASTQTQLRSQSFSWMQVQIGLVPLLARASEHASSNIWLPFFNDSDPDLSLLHDERSGTKGIPDQFVSLFEISPNSDCDYHPYLRPLRRICALLAIEKSPRNVLKFMQFVQGLSSKFIQLLQQLDPRALLLFGYWVSLLRDTELWWCRDRMRNQYRAICAHLKEHHPNMLSYLAIPPTGCGYQLAEK